MPNDPYFMDATLITKTSLSKQKPMFYHGYHCKRRGAHCKKIKGVESVSSETSCTVIHSEKRVGDYGMYNVSCDAAQEVYLICQFGEQVWSEREYRQHISGIKVNEIANHFTRLSIVQGCPDQWFHYHGKCVKFTSQCKGRKHNSCASFMKHSITCKDMKADISRILSQQIWNQTCFINETEMQEINQEALSSLKQIPLRAMDGLTKKSDLTVGMWHPTLCHYEKLQMTLFLNLSNVSIVYEKHIQDWVIESTPKIDTYSYDERRIDFIICEREIPSLMRQLDCGDVYFKCKDGTCVYDSLVCDGVAHCVTGEDEFGCESTCGDETLCLTKCHYDTGCRCMMDYFQCLNGGCVPMSTMCDGHSNCQDGSDEPITCHAALSKDNYNSTQIQTVLNVLNKDLQYCLAQCSQDEVTLNFTIPDETNHCEYPMKRLRLVFLNSIESNKGEKLCGIESYGILHEVYTLEDICIYRYAYECFPGYHFPCTNGAHLKYCYKAVCNHRYKCMFSYCVDLHHLCNGICECPSCDDESFCGQLSCPGYLLRPSDQSSKHCTQNYSMSPDLQNIRLRKYQESTILLLPLDYPVYVYVTKEQEIFEKIQYPALVTFCYITHIVFNDTAVNFIQNMTSLQVLDLSHNSIKILGRRFLAVNCKLVFLDLSHNELQHISNITFCSLMNLKYLYLHYNQLQHVDVETIFSLQTLVIVMLHGNSLRGITTSKKIPTKHLQFVTSDKPRLCCIVNAAISCAPPFTLLSSCEDMIASNIQKTIGWTIGLGASILNTVAVLGIIHSFQFRVSRETLVLVQNLNLAIADSIMSWCFLCIVIADKYYSGEFGPFAYQWAKSSACNALKFLFFISKEASLAFLSFIAVNMALNVTSMIRAPRLLKKNVLLISCTWLVIIGLGFASQILTYIFRSKPYNYLCLPYIFSKEDKDILKIFNGSIIFVNVIFLSITVKSYLYLMHYVKKCGKDLNVVSVKRKAKLKILRLRMHLLIGKGVLTFCPFILIQVISLSSSILSQDIILWITLTSIPLHLFLDPLLITLPSLKKQNPCKSSYI